MCGAAVDCSNSCLVLLGPCQIWRIEDFEPQPVPAEMYGQFYGGDSYIVLYTYLVNGKENYIIYFWLGQESSQVGVGQGRGRWEGGTREERMRGEDPSWSCNICIQTVFMCLRWLAALPLPLPLPQDERAAAAMHTVALDDKYGGAPVQVRVVQYKEPEHFLQIFRGKMVIHAVSVCTWRRTLVAAPGATAGHLCSSLLCPGREGLWLQEPL